MDTNLPRPARPQRPGDSDDEAGARAPRSGAPAPFPAAGAQRGNPPRSDVPAYVEPWLDDPGEVASAPPPRRPTRTLPDEGPYPPDWPAAPAAPATRSAAGRGCLIVAGMALVTVLACLLLFYGTLQSGIERLSGFSFPSFALPNPTPTIDTSQPSVILQVQALSRLETQRYVVEKVIRAEIPGALPLPFSGDKLLFVGHGEAVAGVDLNRVRPEDITITVLSDTRRVEMRLPAVELFHVRLDNDKSYVYDRETGLFNSADPGLETRVRQEAERQIREAALEGGILQQAEANAEKTLRSLLTGLGYDEITITFAPPIVPPATPVP
jgi:hypothetical protein